MPMKCRAPQHVDRHIRAMPPFEVRRRAFEGTFIGQGWNGGRRRPVFAEGLRRESASVAASVPIANEG